MRMDRTGIPPAISRPRRTPWYWTPWSAVADSGAGGPREIAMRVESAGVPAPVCAVVSRVIAVIGAVLILLAGPAAPVAHALPGGFGGGGGAGCGALLFFLLTAFGAVITWIYLMIRSLVGALTEGPHRKTWVGILVLCLLSAAAALTWWALR